MKAQSQGIGDAGENNFKRIERQADITGAVVRRVSAVYSATDQTADWGAPLGPGDSLDIRIFQLSALFGRGAPKTVTLTF